MRVGLFGGSFDPIHHGHLLTARALLESGQVDQVRLVPAGEQPFKAGGHWAAAADRAAMVTLGVDREPGLVVERLEVERAGPSYTVDTVRALQAALPGSELTVFVGSDAAAEFPQWKEAETLRTLARVVVFRRPGALQPSLGAEEIAVPQLDISSTDIRARIRAGRSIRYLVPEGVASYIATHRLYQPGVGKAC
ncbi:MAG: nicotinate (nicotinamide) nucleotide adenylyltransferase [Gemmatimonadetes bacterium]|nr:nicotinate (nicotinamide) nucleotide adenylyltransferase [Gemmatimonadota bacterium]